MNIHVHSIYHKYAKRKTQLARKGRNGWCKSFMAMKEQKGGPLSFVITTYFGSTNLYKINDKA
jgi:hypothetical protein